LLLEDKTSSCGHRRHHISNADVQQCSKAGRTGGVTGGGAEGSGGAGSVPASLALAALRSTPAGTGSMPICGCTVWRLAMFAAVYD
jgi:hypothetical protein